MSKWKKLTRIGDLLLAILQELRGSIMATQAELAGKLDELNVQLTKIGTETQSLLTAIADLRTKLVDAPVNAELQAAFDRVAAQAKVVDDLVPDA